MPERLKVESFDSEGNEKTVYVISPSNSVNREAQMQYNTAFKDAIQSGALLKQKLQTVMEEQGVWSDDKQERYDEILTLVMRREKDLQKGGIKLSKAKKLALEIRDLRVEFRELISERNSMDSNTAEGQADNARFGFIGYACLVDEENKKVFKSYDHYVENENEPFVIQGARELAQMLYGLDADYEHNLPENQFLMDYDFVDEDLRFINKDGQATDIDGRLIDKEGRFVDEDGNYVDKEGEPISEEGKYDVDFSPFLDDDGNPVIKEEEEEEEAAEEEAEGADEAKEPEEAEEAEAEKTEIPKKRRGRPNKAATKPTVAE
jgi:hypothetical protein